MELITAVKRFMMKALGVNDYITFHDTADIRK
jgi:hypothetical protein